MSSLYEQAAALSTYKPDLSKFGIRNISFSGYPVLVHTHCQVRTVIDFLYKDEYGHGTSGEGSGTYNNAMSCPATQPQGSRKSQVSGLQAPAAKTPIPEPNTPSKKVEIGIEYFQP